MYISEHFTYQEVIKSSTASRFHIDNNVSSHRHIKNARELAKHILEPVRKEFGVVVPNSWYRGEELEKVICWNGTEDSPFGRWCRKKGLPIHNGSWSMYFLLKSHPKGESVDLSIAGVSNDDLFNWIDDNLEYDQLIREFAIKDKPYSGWVHVSWSMLKNRHEKFSID